MLLEVAGDADVGLIRGDSRRLGQMLDHLIENAPAPDPGRRPGHPGGRARAAARCAPVVADTGRGIPFHVQAHIFDRFVGRDRGGPGLGLALVKALVELHGGWVALESEPGAGATFTCHLPEAAQRTRRRRSCSDGDAADPRRWPSVLSRLAGRRERSSPMRSWRGSG